MSRRRERFVQGLEGARSSSIGVALMGICNVTPDSFSDGGRYATPEAARARVDLLLAEGADLIDVGGESTRPGAPAVPADEQIARVLEVIRYAVGRGAIVSIDTQDADVAAACLDAGACAVNDVSCLRDERLAQVTASKEAALVLMHARGHQSEMAGYSLYAEAAYGDIFADVMREWRAAAERAVQAGVHRDALIMDPGLGFAKSGRQSMELLRRTRDLAREAGAPVLIGASRKSFLKKAGASEIASERLGSSIAAAMWAAREGAAILRVHDVRATREAIAVDRHLRGVSAEATLAAAEVR